MAHQRVAALRQRPAFSLIELLVVVAIIALLMAIVLPALGHARETAKRTVCATRMREVAQGLNQYVTENQGWLPPAINTVYNYAEITDTPWTMWGAPIGGVNFFNSALPNVRAFVCPSVTREMDGTAPGIGYAPTALSDTNYMANGFSLGRQIVTMLRPGDTILLHEASARSNAVFCRPIRWFPGDFYGINYSYTPRGNSVYQQWHQFTNGVENYGNVHNGGTNLIFVDGHAEYRKYKDLRSRDYGLLPDEPWSKTNSQFPDNGGNSLTAAYKPAF